MTEFFIGTCLFSLGFLGGTYWHSVAFDNMAWEIFRWHSQSLGYRKVGPKSTLYKNEKILMGLYLDTSEFPDEGISYEESEIAP